MSKRKGSHWELKARDILEARGYLVCKAGGSLGIFDLVAVNGQHTRLVQIKGGKRPWCSPKDRQEIADVPAHLLCCKEIWYKKIRKPWRISRLSPQQGGGWHDLTSDACL